MKDKDFILESVKCGAKDYFGVNPEIWSDKALVIEMIKAGANFSALQIALRNDKDIALEAVKIDAYNYNYLSDELKKDSDIICAYTYALGDNRLQTFSTVIGEESKRRR